MPAFSGCKVCQDIWRRFADPETTHKIHFGAYDEALSTECPTHKPLAQRFIEFVRGQDEGADSPSQPEADDLGIREKFRGSCVRISQSISKLGYYWALLLVKRDSVPNHPGTGRILDPDWVDLDIVKKWKDKCLSSHGAKCENPMKIWPTRPLWLIDVEARCLVSGQKPGTFVALSYRYGRSLGLAIDAGTLAHMQQPFALDSLELSKYLSPIVRHAIHLTSSIGERYLWVDALCIPHDNPGATTEQLRMMGAIYASAVVTIIAADGDSEDGLLGIKGISPARQMNQLVIPFGDENLVVRNTHMNSLNSGTEYYERGWTYQEYTMSQRRILFNNHELHWECRCCVWHEEMIVGAETDKSTNSRLAVILAGLPDLGSLGMDIANFNETELRYDEDALPAISGLLSVVSRSFIGGFLCGIPEMFFERGLGWRPYWAHTNLRRRTPSNRLAEHQLSPSQLPSWSWIGWHGLVYLSSQEAARVNRLENQVEETIPITQWYTGNSPDCPLAMRRRIKSTWFENRESYKNFTKPLPPGWTRHDAPDTTPDWDEPHLFPDGCSEFVFQYEGMPDTDEDVETWYYPFPVVDIQESTPPFTPEQTQYLFCNTWNACLWGHQGGNENIVYLCDNSGKQIGTLHAHNTESSALFPQETSESDRGLRVDLVAIYKLRSYRQTRDEESEKYRLPIITSEDYVVLWVEWKDGIAYRLASGQVKAEEWEELDLEPISLTLG